jgi:hypothetical protein
MSVVNNALPVKQAAEEIGCTASHLRKMIRDYFTRSPMGRAQPTATECKAIKVVSSLFPQGHAYHVPLDEISRLRTTVATGGRPRGGKKSDSAEQKVSQ